MHRQKKLPILALLALTVSGFIAIITEVLPAGLLPQISTSLGVSESYAGQFITMYALGSLLAAIPVISLTKNWNRKPLLLISIFGFFLFNLTTFFLNHYFLLLVVRFLAGVSAGIIWGLLTGYTVRMVSPEMSGRALAIVGIGQPIALSLGVPLATWLGNVIGWNTVFLIISILSLFLIFWIIAIVPDFSVKEKGKSSSLKSVISNTKVQRILLITLCWILAHNLLYTYISSFLKVSNLSEYTNWILFLFGMCSIIGIFITGRFIDGGLRKMVIINLIIFCASGIILLIGEKYNIIAYLGIALWGFSFGGAPTLLQKSLADVAKQQIDLAQSIFVTVFNIAVAGGGILGGFLLEYYSISFLLIFFIVLAMVSFLVVISEIKLIKCQKTKI